MCGIAGIFNNQTPVTEEDGIRVKQMCEKMSHRGPDAEGVFSDGKVCLGHRRLAIIDLDRRADQPMTDASGRYTLVFNGQIYNYREIRSSLGDYPFRTTCDTEVLLAAYTRWGKDCLARVNGMFAFAVYDAAEQSLFLARDRLGVKPLYYHRTASRFMFASEIRALMASGDVPGKLSDRGLFQYLLSQSTQCPSTILEDVYQLKPGHFAILNENGFHEEPYWKFGDTEFPETASYSEATRNVRQLLLESVARRLVSDVPLGAFLSGGIDSSAVVALMAQVSDRVSTFSVTFDEKDYDESKYSHAVAHKYRTDHHQILLKPGRLMDDLPGALDAMDSPSGDGINTYIISKHVKSAGLTVALSGLGSDEIFAGYHYFRLWQRLHQYGYFRWPVPVRRFAGLLRGERDASRKERLKQLAHSDGSIETTYPVFRQVTGTAVAHEMLRRIDQSADRNGISQFQKSSKWQTFPRLSQLSIAELNGYTLNVLLKDTDQFSMASALEVREPFFDYRLVDYVLRLPDKWKMGSTPKRLLVDAMGDLLPPEIVHRPKKGFMLPWEHWLKHELASFAEDQVRYLEDRKEFEGAIVRNIWSAYKSNKNGVGWAQVWQLVALAYWLRKNVEN